MPSLVRGAIQFTATSFFAILVYACFISLSNLDQGEQLGSDYKLYAEFG